MSLLYTKELGQGRFETWGERPGIEFHEVKQVHSIEIVSPETLPSEADGLVASWEELSKALAIKTADCMPIVVEGKEGALHLHAGWRGLASGILKRPELAMIHPRKIFIGPSIQECCFEVTSEFKSNFFSSPNFSTREGKLYFNLQAEARAELEVLFPEAQVDLAPNCTCCDHKFHSYRRDKTKQRNWNLYIKG